MSPPHTLFIAHGAGGVGWYRCALPAMALGHDWVGLVGEGRATKIRAGVTARPFALADIDDYEVVVMSMLQPGWARTVRRLQAAGTTVIADVDDYFQALSKQRDYELAGSWSRKLVEGMEMMLRLVDGIVVSTDFLAHKYRTLNANIRVCRNGIDLRRYAYERPPRDSVTIGWAGGAGHKDALTAWLPQVAGLMRRHPDVHFSTVGQPYGQPLEAEFGTERVSVIPWGVLETYPASMAAFDIVLAPAGKTNFYRGKSDLRWLEASALGVPCVADPFVYPDIDPGVTGLHATSPQEAGAAIERLLQDSAYRASIGAAAHEHVREHRSFPVAARQWDAALQELGSARHAPASPVSA